MYGIYNNIAKNIVKNYKLSNLNFLRPCTKLIQNRTYINFIKSFIENKGTIVRKQNFVSKPYDVDTNVLKDVIIFKYENPRFFKVINIFAISQFLFWNYLSHFAYTELRDAPVDQAAEDSPWFKKINLGDNKYRNGLTIISFLIGYGILAAAWLFTLRSVRFLILQKGGKSVSFVTYTPFGKNRILTSVPLKSISAETSRETAKTQLPIKIQNRKLFYILDMRGEFTNPRLFDYTVGLKRRIVD